MNGTQRTCRHCRRAIEGADYRVVGYEVNDGGIPVNLYVHRDCQQGYAAAEQRREQLLGVTVRVQS